MFEGLKNHLAKIVISAVIVILLFIFSMIKDTIVEQYMVPIVLDKVKEKGYITKSEILENSKNLEKDNKVLQDKIENLNNTVKDSAEMILDIKEQHAITKNKLEELNTLLDAIVKHELKVKVFKSNIKIDEDSIVLNINNKMIKNLIENGKSYRVYNESGQYLTLIARVEPASDLNKKNDREEPVGRVYINDYHDLFNGNRSGSRIVSIRINE